MDADVVVRKNNEKKVMRNFFTGEDYVPELLLVATTSRGEKFMHGIGDPDCLKGVEHQVSSKAENLFKVALKCRFAELPRLVVIDWCGKIMRGE